MTMDQQIGVVLLVACRCRCGHEWLPREKGEKPRVCPKCKSPRWDLPKKFERSAQAPVPPVAQAPPAKANRSPKPKSKPKSKG